MLAHRISQFNWDRPRGGPGSQHHQREVGMTPTYAAAASTPREAGPAPTSETSPSSSSKPAAATSPSTSAKASTLPFTGLDLRWTIAIGLLLIAAGGSIVLMQRRQRRGTGR